MDRSAGPANCRGMEDTVSGTEAADRVPTPAERDGIATIMYRWKGDTRRWSIGCDMVQDNQETIRAHLARWIPGAEFVAVEFQHVRPPKLLAAARLAFEALERRSRTRRKWTLLDQQAFEALQAALTEVEPEA